MEFFVPKAVSTVNRNQQHVSTRPKRAVSKPGRKSGSFAVPKVSHTRSEIIAHATEALDCHTNAMRWLQKPNLCLAGKTPLDVLTHGSSEETEPVDELLYGLEYGMYA